MDHRSDEADERHALLLALAEVLCPSLNGPSSHALADAVEMGCVTPGGAVDFLSDSQADWLRGGWARVTAERIEHWSGRLQELAASGAWMVDASEEEYPTNLRMIHNRPPFLMVRGSLTASDERAIAVVGTRRPSDEGRRCAYQLAARLAEQSVTVVSGLAAGIDTAAHAGALSAGGRTIAVYGTGINVVFPAANRALAGSVAAAGACVSQFWPDMRGARWSFPVRNLVTSGLSLGTVVVEAGETSGARRQAEAAVLHGKRVFLMRQLIDTQPWAREIAGQPGVAVMDSVDEVITSVDVDLLTDSAVLL